MTPRKILIVDEKPFMLRLIELHLERAGYQLIKARNRQEAMQALAEQSPELVVMDDCGDPLNEHQTLESFPSNNPAHKIPVIRMTEFPQNGNTVSKNLGAEVIFTKPFSPTHLVAEVKRLVHDV